jgi:hypothetical protein
MKLSVDRLPEYDRLALVLPALAQSLRGRASWARRLDDPTVGGGTNRLEPAAQHALGLTPGLPPPLGDRLALPHALQSAPRALWLLPSCQPDLWAQRLREAPQAHATLPRTAGGVCWGRLHGGSRAIALPRLHPQCYWPAQRRDREDRSGTSSRAPGCSREARPTTAKAVGKV